MKKRIFDIIFIVVSALVLVFLLESEISDKFIGFLLIPILIAYYLGQYSERKFNK